MESHGCRQAHKTQDSYNIALNPINLYARDARACLHCSPPARWGLLDFKSCFRVLLLPPPSSFLLLASSSTASSRLVWASPDLNRRESKPCGPLPDLNRRESKPCGPRRTSTGEIWSAVGFAGPQPAIAVGLAGPQRLEKKPERMPEIMSDRTPERMSNIDC